MCVSVCVSLFACMYACLCICVSICMYMSVCVCVCMCVCIGVCISVCLCVCVSMWEYICLCVCEYVCICMCVVVCVCVSGPLAAHLAREFSLALVNDVSRTFPCLSVVPSFASTSLSSHPSPLFPTRPTPPPRPCPPFPPPLIRPCTPALPLQVHLPSPPSFYPPSSLPIRLPVSHLYTVISFARIQSTPLRFYSSLSPSSLPPPFLTAAHPVRFLPAPSPHFVPVRPHFVLLRLLPFHQFSFNQLRMVNFRTSFNEQVIG